MTLNYKEFGQGEPLLILHGLFGMLDNWQSIAKKLSEHFLVYIIDQRNHGKSPHSDDYNYDILADDLLEFMEARELRSAHLVGHSMGGKTAMHFALRYPAAVRSLVVVDIAPRAYQGGHEAYFEAMLALDLTKIKERKEAEHFLATRIADAAELQFLLKNLSRNDVTDEHFEWKMNLRSLYRNYPTIMGGVGAAGETLDKPTLFVRGGRSQYIREDDKELILTRFPKAQLVTIPNAGHWVHAEQPEAFLAAITDFLVPQR